MSDYFIKYKNLAIYAEESRKLIRVRNYICKVVSTDADISFDKDKTKNPLTKRTIKKEGDVYKKFVKACSHLI